MPRFNGNAYFRAVGMQPDYRQPRPIQRIPARPEPTETEIARESRQIYYGQLMHDGHDEETAYALTVQHFAIADHRMIGTIRDEE